MRLLVSRDDRLGDFMLAWPALQSIHCNLPEANLTVLAGDDAAALAPLCPGLNQVITVPRDGGELARARRLAVHLRPYRFAAALALFSRFDLALGLALARIPLRLAPATKPAQIFYTHRLRQHRSRSERPEHVYNLELAEHFLALLGVRDPVRPEPPFLCFDPSVVSRSRLELAARLGFGEHLSMAVLHPGHGGSAPRPPAALFVEIARELAAEGAVVIISEGPADAAVVAELTQALGAVPYKVLRSASGLVDYARCLAAADLFVSGSTGPLHIAGALDVPTVAFYPRRRSATALRWQTLNRPERRLVFMPPDAAPEAAFGTLDARQVAGRVREFFRAVRDRSAVATDPRT